MTTLPEPTLLSLIARYGLEAKLALIPWERLPADLRQVCAAFLAAWWDALDPDEPIQVSGLMDMTVAQLLTLWGSQCSTKHDLAAADQLGRRYRVVSYLRVEPEEPDPVSLGAALSEIEQLQLLSPESVHRIEEA